MSGPERDEGCGTVESDERRSDGTLARAVGRGETRVSADRDARAPGGGGVRVGCMAGSGVGVPTDHILKIYYN